MREEKQKRLLIRHANYEKLILIGAIVFAVSFIYAGYYFTVRNSDPHWMNRIGAAIVTIEVLIVILEKMRQARLEQIHRDILKKKKRSHGLSPEKKESLFQKEARKAEFQVVRIAATLAILGETLHGFGDVLFVFLIGDIKH